MGHLVRNKAGRIEFVFDPVLVEALELGLGPVSHHTGVTFVDTGSTWQSNGLAHRSHLFCSAYDMTGSIDIDMNIDLQAIVICAAVPTCLEHGL